MNEIHEIEGKKCKLVKSDGGTCHGCIFSSNQYGCWIESVDIPCWGEEGVDGIFVEVTE